MEQSVEVRSHNWAFARGLGRVVFWVLSLLAVSPVVFTIILAFRSTSSIEASPLALPSPWILSNFATAWQAGGMASAYASSVLCTVISVLVIAVFAQLLAYVIVRRGTTSASALMIYILLGLMVPFPTRVLPLFTLMTWLHLTGSVASVVLFQIGSLMPLSVLVYVAFLRRLPVDYEEAAYVDGAGIVRLLWSVVVPLLRPVTGAVATLTGIIIWNDFFTPLMLVGGSSSATLPVAIYSFVGQYASQWGEIFAGITLASLPVIVAFVAFQKYLVQGLGSGVKG